MKMCPHCRADTLGTAQLLSLDYFATAECTECKQLIRNDGLRQFLVIPSILGALAVGLLLFSVIPEVLQPFAILLTFILVALALTVLPKPVKHEIEVVLPSFSPNPENDKVITVCGWSETQLQQMLGDFAAIYNSGWPRFRTEVARENESCLWITFPEDIHPSLFAFLVDYVNHPFGFDRRDRNITVEGRTALDGSFDGIPEELFGESAILYSSKKDEEVDVVYLRSETGQDFMNLLGENDWQRVSQAALPQKS